LVVFMIETWSLKFYMVAHGLARTCMFSIELRLLLAHTGVSGTSGSPDTVPPRGRDKV
jgi:hypothetical protein